MHGAGELFFFFFFLTFFLPAVFFGDGARGGCLASRKGISTRNLAFGSVQLCFYPEMEIPLAKEHTMTGWRAGSSSWG